MIWGYSRSTVQSYDLSGVWYCILPSCRKLSSSEQSHSCSFISVQSQPSKCKQFLANLESLHKKHCYDLLPCSAGTRAYGKGAGGVMTLETTAAAYGLTLWSPILNRNKLHFHSKPIGDFLYRLKINLSEKRRQNRWSAVGKHSGNSGQTQMEISPLFGSSRPEIHFSESIERGRVELRGEYSCAW